MTKEINKYLEASLEGAEAIADALTESELIKSIPVVGTALKVIAGTQDLRDKIFISKIQRFLQEIENISTNERLHFKESITSDEESLTRTGETALLVIDKLSDIKKAELLGLYYVSFLCGEIDQHQFRRIASAIDIGFIDDIEEFLKKGEEELRSQKYYIESLSSSGITAISAGKTYGDSGQLFYEASSMGRTMIELWKKYKQS
jgi:hypothetical protein